MVILVDTNIIVDVLMKREPYMQEAQEILIKCASREITGYLAAHSIPNLFYILRKSYTQEERRTFIKELCSIFRISDLNAKKILSAAENKSFSLLHKNRAHRLACTLLNISAKAVWG